MSGWVSISFDPEELHPPTRSEPEPPLDPYKLLRSERRVYLDRSWMGVVLDESRAARQRTEGEVTATPNRP